MKLKEKKEAIELRKKGWSINKIYKHLNVGKGTVSLWVRDVHVDEELRNKLDRKLKFDKDRAVKLFLEGKSYAIISHEVGICKSQLISWLGRNGYRRKRQSYPYCQACGEKNHKSMSKYCSRCTTALRRYANKIRAVEYKGGKCHSCGAEFEIKDYAAYEFHHLHDKDLSIGQMSNVAWKRLKDELDKCIMLCSNCHRKEHSGFDNDRLIRIAIEMLN